MSFLLLQTIAAASKEKAAQRALEEKEAPPDVDRDTDRSGSPFLGANSPLRGCTAWGDDEPSAWGSNAVRDDPRPVEPASSPARGTSAWEEPEESIDHSPCPEIHENPDAESSSDEVLDGDWVFVSSETIQSISIDMQSEDTASDLVPTDNCVLAGAAEITNTNEVDGEDKVAPNGMDSSITLNIDEELFSAEEREEFQKQVDALLTAADASNPISEPVGSSFEPLESNTEKDIINLHVSMAQNAPPAATASQGVALMSTSNMSIEQAVYDILGPAVQAAEATAAHFVQGEQSRDVGRDILDIIAPAVQRLRDTIPIDPLLVSQDGDDAGENEEAKLEEKSDDEGSVYEPESIRTVKEDTAENHIDPATPQSVLRRSGRLSRASAKKTAAHLRHAIEPFVSTPRTTGLCIRKRTHDGNKDPKTSSSRKTKKIRRTKEGRPETLKDALMYTPVVNSMHNSNDRLKTWCAQHRARMTKKNRTDKEMDFLCNLPEQIDELEGVEMQKPALWEKRKLRVPWTKRLK